MKKVIAIAVLVILLCGLGFGIYYLVNNPTILNSSASCASTGCNVLADFDSDSYNIPTGTNIPIKVTLNTSNVEVQYISILIKYNATDYSILKPTNIDLDPIMVSAGWTKEISHIDTPGRIELSARYTITSRSSGYKNNTPTNFAVITLQGISDGVKTLSFDRSSQVTTGTNGTDILKTPSDSTKATVTIGTGTATAAPAGANSLSAPNTNTIKPLLDTFTNNQTLTASPKTLSGTAKPGAIISISIHSSQSLTGSSTANASGVWTWPVPDTLTNGAHTITLTDNQTPPQTTTLAFTITPNGSASGNLTKPLISTISKNQVLTVSPTIISGTAIPGAILSITVNSSQTLNGTVTANLSGVWTWTLPDTLTNGAHTITITDDQTPPQTTSLNFSITPKTTTDTTTETSTKASDISNTDTLPVTGTLENSLVFGFAGIITILAGAALFVF